mmetsp:Transcript_81477/g.236243  ORF Transcript_81477/g.236243 Transcript_81477/m.236243 type:complete len:223 (+) Transcript_81477:462-1130(+)
MGWPALGAMGPPCLGRVHISAGPQERAQYERGVSMKSMPSIQPGSFSSGSGSSSSGSTAVAGKHESDHSSSSSPPTAESSPTSVELELPGVPSNVLRSVHSIDRTWWACHCKRRISLSSENGSGMESRGSGRSLAFVPPTPCNNLPNTSVKATPLARILCASCLVDISVQPPWVNDPMPRKSLHMRSKTSRSSTMLNDCAGWARRVGGRRALGNRRSSGPCA